MEIDLERKEKHEKEILEMILQFCYENKYHDTAKLLESKTDIIYDQNEIQELKYLLKEHEFEKSIKFLEKSNFQNLQKNEVLKVIKSRRLIEMIKNAQFENALEFIRKELSPLFQNFNILNKFSSMLFIKDKDKLERYLRQNFNDIVIDDSLIVKVQNLLCLSLDSNGNRILPNSRLENLLNKYYNIIESENFIKDHYNGNSDSIYLNKNPSGNQDKYSDKKNINLNEDFDTEMDIEIVIDKEIEEVYETFEKYKNYSSFKKENKIKNNSYNHIEGVNQEANLHINNTFSFQQIFSIEKNEEEVWHLEFTLSNSHFATCNRNGVICIFRFENKESRKDIHNIHEINILYGLNSKKNNIDNIEFNKFNSNHFVIKSLNSFLAHKKSVSCLSWSKNEKFLLTSSINKEIFLWDPFEGVVIKKFITHSDIVTSVKWINDETFVSGSIDKKMRIESIEKGLIFSETFARIRKILISELYNYIIILPASLNDIILYDCKNFREVNRLTELDPIISANISQKDQGRQLIVNFSKVNASINLYEISNLKLINKFYGHSQEQYQIECNFAGDFDEFIICGSEDASIFIWHVSDSIPIRVIKGHTGCINSCHLIKFFEKNLIFSASDDHTIRIWGPKDVTIEYIDDAASHKKNVDAYLNKRSLNYSNFSLNASNNIFDVIDMSNLGMNNNDISLNDESREEPSDYYSEDDS